MRRKDNQVLLLYALSFIERIPNYELTPFVFLLQKEGRDRKQKTVNYPFAFAWKRPLSEEVREDVGIMEREGWIQVQRDITVTALGREMLGQYMSFIREATFETFMVWFVSKYPFLEYERYCAIVYVERGNLFGYENVVPHFSNRKLGKHGAVTSKVIQEMLRKYREESEKSIEMYRKAPYN